MFRNPYFSPFFSVYAFLDRGKFVFRYMLFYKHVDPVDINITI